MIVGKLIWIPHNLLHSVAHWGLIIGMFIISIFGFKLSITVPTALTIMRILGHMKDHSGHVPYFAQFMTEFLTSIERIQDFLKLSEVETQLLSYSQEETSEAAIRAENSNFFWGFEEEDSDDEDTKAKNNKEDKLLDKDQCSKKLELSDDKSTFTEESDSQTQELKNKLCLKKIELKIKKKEFVAVIGEVGSGKSSLIHSLLGETLYIDESVLAQFDGVDLNQVHNDISNLDHESVIDQIKRGRKEKAQQCGPKIFIEGSVSLVEQKPFILSKPIRDNILFGEELDPVRYNRVVEVCQLGRDLQILSGGDLTQIGEKGVNLSGGQKARLSLARAVYSSSDIVLLDDPLSALDAHVKKAVFDQVLCGELKDRTRVLVTHAVDFLDRVDRIVVVHKGEIILDGSFDQLSTEPYFQKIINAMHTKEELEPQTPLIDYISPNTSPQERKDYMSVENQSPLDDEEHEDCDVHLSTYLEYFNYFRPAMIIMAICFLLLILERVVKMQQDYYLLNWVKDFSSSQKIDSSILLKISGTIILCICMDLLQSLLEVFRCYVIDKELFSKMMQRMLHAPINLFFDKTTSGRILTRFSVDLDMTGQHLPNVIKWVLRNY